MGALSLPVPPTPKLVMGVERRRLPPLDDSYSQGVGSQAREVAQLTNTLHKL